MFNKSKNQRLVRVEVRHAWHPGTVFAFTFPKVLTQETLEAEKTYLGLTAPEQEDEARKALINVVALMSAQEPEGFEDLPGSVERARLREIDERLAQLAAAEQADAGEVERLNAERAGVQTALNSAQATPLAERARTYFDDPSQPELESIVAKAWETYKRGSRPEGYIKSISGDGA